MSLIKSICRSPAEAVTRSGRVSLGLRSLASLSLVSSSKSETRLTRISLRRISWFQTASSRTHLFEDLLEFDERDVPVVRTHQPSINIHYFTDSHRGSTTFWGTSDGRLHIKLVCDHLAKTLPKVSFWSGNTVVQHLMEHRLKGELIAASAAGLNKHRMKQHCAIIFSGKATSADKGMMAVFSLTKDDIERAREDELIAQFAMRGAIRNLEFDGAYDIYVYEKVQADRLKAHFDKLLLINVELAPVDEAGLMKVRRKSDGPSEQEKEAKKADRKKDAAKRGRDKRAAAAKAAGRDVGLSGNPKLKKARST